MGLIQDLRALAEAYDRTMGDLAETCWAVAQEDADPGVRKEGEMAEKELCRFCGATRETANDTCPDHFDEDHEFGPASEFTGEWLPPTA